MKIREFKEILNDKSMEAYNTNIRVYKAKQSGKMTIDDVHQEVVELKDIVLAFITEQRKVNADQAKFNTKQEKFNQLILNRINNLVKKNNLKE